MYTLGRQCAEDILHYSKAHFPFESCGIITSNNNKDMSLAHFYPIKNIHPNPRHFYRFDEQEWIDCNLKLFSNNEYITCYVHSHIDAPPHLSQADVDGIYDYSALQMIVHFEQKKSPQFYLYRFNANTKAYENSLLTLT